MAEMLFFQIEWRSNGTAPSSFIVPPITWTTESLKHCIGLFTQDAVFDQSGQILQGHEEMRAAFRDRPKSLTTRHLATNLRFTDIRHDHAKALIFGISYHSNEADESSPVTYAFSNGTLPGHARRLCADRRRVALPLTHGEGDIRAFRLESLTKQQSGAAIEAALQGG